MLLLLAAAGYVLRRGAAGGGAAPPVSARARLDPGIQAPPAFEGPHQPQLSLKVTSAPRHRHRLSGRAMSEISLKAFFADDEARPIADLLTPEPPRRSSSPPPPSRRSRFRA